MKKTNKVMLIVILIMVLLILLDQGIKLFIVENPENTIINGVLKFKLVENTGAAFGIGEDSTISYIVINIVVLGIITKFMVNGNQLIDMKTKVLLSLILAGGLSNLIDRIFRGYVIDYIDFTQIINFPIFNLADICITIGWVGVAAIFAVFTIKEKRNKKTLDIGSKN